MVADAYQSYTCVEAIALSMLFNLDLYVSDNLREKQLKDRERVQLANPFATRQVREKTKEQEAVEEVKWKPKFSSFSAPQAGSAVVMALAKREALPAPAPVKDGAAADEPDPLQRPVDPRLLIGKQQVRPVKHINPRPGVSRPSVALHARVTHAWVRFQV